MVLAGPWRPVCREIGRKLRPVCGRRKEGWSSSQSAPGRTKGSEGLVLVFFFGLVGGRWKGTIGMEAQGKEGLVFGSVREERLPGDGRRLYFGFRVEKMEQ